MLDLSQVEGKRTTASQYDGNSNVLDVAGCFAFHIKNTGNVRAFLFGIVPLEPGEFVKFNGSDGLVFLNDVNLEFSSGPTNGLEVKQVLVIKHVPVFKANNEDKGLL